MRRERATGSSAAPNVAVTGDDNVTINKTVRQMADRIQDLERQLGRKTLEVEVLKEALDK